MPLSQLQPAALWQAFTLINSVPRPSKQEARIIQVILNFAEQHNLTARTDAIGNIIITKPASAGMESRKPIVLQGHIDMVCQKNNATEFDFDTQAVQMWVDGDWVRARGTTLGADNGLGVAAILAVLASHDIAHPAIEALLTVDEEAGMGGAFGLQTGELTGEILLNLDTEDDEEIIIGCAGGINIHAHQTYPTAPIPAAHTVYQLQVKGLLGGHSGMDIHRGRANANLILARLLHVATAFDARLIHIDGGTLRNAIAREAQAHISVADAAAFQSALNTLLTDILAEYARIEPNISIEFTPIDPSVYEQGKDAISHAHSQQLIHTLLAAHHGVYRMSPDVDGLVEASNNLAMVRLNAGLCSIECLARSSVESSKTAVVAQLQSVFALAGMMVTTDGDYPGWKPNPDTPIVKTVVAQYQATFGHVPRVLACHAGLECGIIGAQYPTMDMVSFGPTIHGAHSPDERASIISAQKFWRFLGDVLANSP